MWWVDYICPQIVSFFCSFFPPAALGLSCSLQDLVPWPGTEPGPPALGVQRLNHHATGDLRPFVPASLYPYPLKVLFTLTLGSATQLDFYQRNNSKYDRGEDLESICVLKHTFLLLLKPEATMWTSPDRLLEALEATEEVPDIPSVLVKSDPSADCRQRSKPRLGYLRLSCARTSSWTQPKLPTWRIKS